MTSCGLVFRSNRGPGAWIVKGMGAVELEPEEIWLRKRIIRLRTVLRYAKDPRTEAGLKEFIGDAEHRLEMLQKKPIVVQQQQQVQPKQRKPRIQIIKRVTSSGLVSSGLSPLPSK